MAGDILHLNGFIALIVTFVASAFVLLIAEDSRAVFYNWGLMIFVALLTGLTFATLFGTGWAFRLRSRHGFCSDDGQYNLRSIQNESELVYCTGFTIVNGLFTFVSLVLLLFVTASSWRENEIQTIYRSVKNSFVYEASSVSITVIIAFLYPMLVASLCRLLWRPINEFIGTEASTGAFFGPGSLFIRGLVCIMIGLSIILITMYLLNQSSLSALELVVRTMSIAGEQLVYPLIIMISFIMVTLVWAGMILWARKRLKSETISTKNDHSRDANETQPSS